jgi:hypothetical protein
MDALVNFGNIEQFASPNTCFPALDFSYVCVG